MADRLRVLLVWGTSGVLGGGVRAELALRLPKIAALSNPLDMTADVGADQYRETLRTLLANPEVDGALVIATPTGTMTGELVAQAILDAKRSSEKAIVACLFGLTDLSHEVEFLEGQGVPTFTFPEEAIQGLGSLARFHAWRTRPRTEYRTFPVEEAVVRQTLAESQSAGVTVLPEYAARSLLSAYGISFPKVVRVTRVDEAVRAADGIGYPVVLKVASPDISHKTDVGGVAVGIEDGEQLRGAWERMERSVKSAAPTARVEGFEVEAQIQGGKEVLVGVQRDPDFGPIVVFGMGGIYVEVLRDVTFRLAPVRPLSVQRMVESIKSFALLKGVRGEAPSDLDALEEAIERISQLATDLPQVVELDLNPLIVRPKGQGVVAVDARVVLAPSSK